MFESDYPHSDSNWPHTRKMLADALAEVPDDEARKKISVVQERLVKEYGYDEHSAQEALNYVTTLLSQE